MPKRKKILTLTLLNSALMAADPCCLPTCCPELIEECCECNVCPPTCEITPKAGPCVKEGSGIYVTADFTYWTAREDNLEFAMTQSERVVSGTSTKAPKSRIYQLDSHWAPGFKVGVGHDLCFDGWDVYAEYTWFNSTVKRKTPSSLSSALELSDSFWLINNPNLVTLAGTTPVPLFSLPGSSASAKWHLAFNVVDLEFGRNFYISRRIMFRPYLGLKGTWQTQKLDVDFNGTGLNFAVVPVPVQASMKNKMENWGVGILTGVGAAFHITREFSIVSNLALSALWEQFKIHRLDNAFSSSVGVAVSSINVRNQFHSIKPVLEWMIGVRWETWFSCDTYHFAVDGGWEIQNWFSQNKFIRSAGSASSNSGDLTLQGLTIRTRIDF